MYSVIVIFWFFLVFTNQVLGGEVCDYILGTYCDDGYYCCYGDTRCCSNGLSVGAWVGIVLGIMAFNVVIIVLIVRACRRHRARHAMATRPTVTVATVGTVPPPGNQQYDNQYGNQYSPGNTNLAMQQTPKGPMCPPPAYTAP